MTRFGSMPCLLVILLLAAIGRSTSYSVSTSRSNLGSVSNRGAFLRHIGAGCAATFLLPTQSAIAKEIDPALKGTKADPEYQSCLSTCIYECTKPKGVEQKTRAECLPECKSKCATTKQQLLTGAPKSE
mmetsp:Transcript_4250/g.9425  ORF Transcript_4250/g.9425 Transcript_4250/m.9425 type:complete len:129 (-) Transcript_4250:39-425(-)